MQAEERGNQKSTQSVGTSNSWCVADAHYEGSDRATITRPWRSA